MSLPSSVTSYHTVWVHCPTCRPHAVRYAVAGDRVVCFGDRELVDVPDGTRAMAAVHEIAGGPPVAQFSVMVREVHASDVEDSALYELLDHVALGRTRDETAASFARHRQRRLIELVP